MNPTLQSFFPGFRGFRLDTSGAVINGVIGGQGPPVLLLHGWPQTLIEWHAVATQLVKHFTVVATDLRGYGDSGKPTSAANHEPYSKRAMAFDQVEVMRQLGFERFAVAGHDRGGRVAHRMALDHPAAVAKLAVLDIVPTLTVYSSVTKELASSYFHWFFLTQPAPLPETLLAASSEFFLRQYPFNGLIPHVISAPVFDEYLRCFRDPAAIHAACEDYRAAATIDLEHDREDLHRPVECPLLTLWAARGAMAALYDVLATWIARGKRVQGHAILGGHFLPEECPAEVSAALLEFLST
jgi:haloacetate dehalogenase